MNEEVELNVEMTYIEPKKHPCDMCKEKDSFYMVLCKRPDLEKSAYFNHIEIPNAAWMHLCKDCADSNPYETIPMQTSMDAGYFYCPYPVDLVDKPVLLDPEDFNPRKGVLTKYGKELIRQGAKYYKTLTIGDFVKESEGEDKDATDCSL